MKYYQDFTGIAEELIDPIASFIADRLKMELFDMEGDKPFPSDEVQDALRQGAGFIQVRPDRNSYLLVSHVNDRLVVHRARIDAEIQSAQDFHNYDDTLYLEPDRCVVVNSPKHTQGYLIHELEGEYGSDDDSPKRLNISVLELEMVDVSAFIRGLLTPVNQPAGT